VDRRTFSAGLILATLGVTGTAFTQPARKIHRIGIIVSSGKTSELIAPEPLSASVSALLRGLRELGYTYGQDFLIEARTAEGIPARFPVLAAELVRLKVDVIVAPPPPLSAIKQATSTIPVVMAGAIDPVADGLVQSLGHPGGNFTGLSGQSADLMGKRLELLKELVPAAPLVAVLLESKTGAGWHAVEAAARERGWKLLPLEVRNASEVESAFAAAIHAHAGALFVMGGASLLADRQRVAGLAARNRLPAIYPQRLFVDAGGLMSYAADPNEAFRRAAFFVDKILKGAKPADLPVEQPTKFELVINKRTAKTMGLSIPISLMLRADEIIQ
jgi:putative ABC transport system substrate-binding protein